MRKVLLLLFLLILPVLLSTASAEDINTDEIIEEEIYKFPFIEPEINIFGGLRLVDISDSERADEFEYLHSSITLGGELRIFKFPHRFHLELDVKNEKDYYGDISYSFKDIFLFRGINSTLFHNLENIRLVDIETGTASPGITFSDDPDEEYGIKAGITQTFIRFKTPNFPAHLYINARLVDKDGTIQQRSLLGEAWWTNLIRDSQERDIDWLTKDIIIGTNSHLGPVEIDISHGEKRFDVGGDDVLYNQYTQVFGPRATGIYPHNRISEFKGSSNTLKLHTSYTGRIVASATLSSKDRENKYSGAESDYFIGTGEVAWVASKKLAFFLRYKHKDIDLDNPDSVSISDITNTNIYTYTVKNSISSKTDTVSLTGRYRPLSGLSLRAKYTYDDIRRENAEEWDIPKSTQKNTASLSANFRVIKGLTLKAKYTHKDISSPAYNIEPDYSNEGKISISWIPLPKLNTLFSYNIAKEKRDNLHFADKPDLEPEPEERDVTRERLLGSITLLAFNDLSVTTSYAYIRSKTKQDILYHDTTLAAAGRPNPDFDVPYEDTANNYAADLTYIPKDNLTLNAGVSHTVSKGTFSPNDLYLLEPVSISSFSKLKIRETVYSASGEYDFKGGYSTGLQYRFTDYHVVSGDPYNDYDDEDGESHIILFTITKKW